MIINCDTNRGKIISESIPKTNISLPVKNVSHGHKSQIIMLPMDSKLIKLPNITIIANRIPNWL